MSLKSKPAMICFLAILLSISQLALPTKALSDEGEYGSKKYSYERGRIRTVDGYEIKFSSLTVTGVEISYIKHARRRGTRTYGSDRRRLGKAKTTEDTVATSIDNIIRIETESGSKAAEMGLAFFVAGALGSVLGLRDVMDNEIFEEPSIGTKLAIGAGVTLGMTLIGMMWGSTIKEYKTVWTNPAFDKESITSYLHLSNRDGNILLYAGFNF